MMLRRVGCCGSEGWLCFAGAILERVVNSVAPLLTQIILSSLSTHHLFHDVRYGEEEEEDSLSGEEEVKERSLWLLGWFVGCLVCWLLGGAMDEVEQVVENLLCISA